MVRIDTNIIYISKDIHQYIILGLRNENTLSTRQGEKNKMKKENMYVKVGHHPTN
jgi:hypothetical protein